jgi:hypothetical protein
MEKNLGMNISVSYLILINVRQIVVRLLEDLLKSNKKC